MVHCFVAANVFLRVIPDTAEQTTAARIITADRIVRHFLEVNARNTKRTNTAVSAAMILLNVAKHVLIPPAIQNIAVPKVPVRVKTRIMTIIRARTANPDMVYARMEPVPALRNKSGVCSRKKKNHAVFLPMSQNHAVPIKLKVPINAKQIPVPSVSHVLPLLRDTNVLRQSVRIPRCFVRRTAK